MAVCSLCGTTSGTDPGADVNARREGEQDVVPLAWATSVENGSVHVYCPACARENLRSIEAKLDSAWF